MLHSTAPTSFPPPTKSPKNSHLTTPAETRTLSSLSDDEDSPWTHGRVPNGYWDIREHRIQYLTWLGKRYGFRTSTDWYAVRKSHFQKNGGGGLLRNVYQSSVLKAMIDFRPNFEWKAWMFGGAPNGFWKSATNRQHYMNWLTAQLNISKTEDWYGVTGADFFAHHGGGLLNNEFNGSVQAVLLDFKPDFPWRAWRFPSVPQGFWFESENRRSYLRWLGSELGFKTQAHWKRLTRQHFYDNYGSGLFVGYYNGSTEQAIEELFPPKSLRL